MSSLNATDVAITFMILWQSQFDAFYNKHNQILYLDQNGHELK